MRTGDRSSEEQSALYLLAEDLDSELGGFSVEYDQLLKDIKSSWKTTNCVEQPTCLNQVEVDNPEDDDHMCESCLQTFYPGR